MHPRTCEMGQKSEKKPCNVHITKTATVKKGTSPIFDVEISGGWSFRPLRKQQFVDQIFHLSVFFCLIILVCYIIAVHTLLYYETQDTTNLKSQVEYAFTLNEYLKNLVQSLEFSLDSVKKDLAQLRLQVETKGRMNQSQDRQRRSTSSQNRNVTSQRKKMRRDRTKNIETVAIQFTPAGTIEFDINPMQGELGPWMVGSDFNNNLESFGASFHFHGRKIEISREGLYYVYSQVTYHNEGKQAGYYINVVSTSNVTGETTDTSIAQCNTIGHQTYRTVMSCHTSSIRILYPKDILYLQQSWPNRTIFWENDMTYFGLILLSEP